MKHNQRKDRRGRRAAPSSASKPDPDATVAPAPAESPPGVVLSAHSHGPEHPPAETAGSIDRMRRALDLTPDVPDRQVFAEAAERLEETEPRP